MKLNQFLKESKKATKLPITVNGHDIDDIYFRRLSAGEGIQLKDAFSRLMENAGDVIGNIEEHDVAKAEEKARKHLSPEQLRAMFEFQAMFTYLHLSDANGDRRYSTRKEFDSEVPDDLIPVFYQEGSEFKKETEAGLEDAEKNSSTPTD
jgi:hypothetical protein